ncbi:MAG: L-carnitine dehydratase, partial [Acidimicrobiia bacterium]|nr:L-carnitine dehydratase [Acidimicrobiia bacterium]
MAGPLDGVRVLDLTHGIAGPVATMLLADAGADVTRIERPEPSLDCSGYPVWNRRKRCRSLDLASDRGHKELLELVDGADVLMESFRPGTTQRLGIDFARLSIRNPKLIYCSIT